MLNARSLVEDHRVPEPSGRRERLVERLDAHGARLRYPGRGQRPAGQLLVPAARDDVRVRAGQPERRDHLGGLGQPRLVPRQYAGDRFTIVKCLGGRGDDGCVPGLVQARPAADVLQFPVRFTVQKHMNAVNRAHRTEKVFADTPVTGSNHE
jgi:hypothetical protein